MVFLRGISLLTGLILLGFSLSLALARQAKPDHGWVGYVAKADGQVYLVNPTATHTRRLPNLTTVSFKPMLNVQPQPISAAPLVSPDGQWQAVLEASGWQRDIFLRGIHARDVWRLTHFADNNSDVIRFSWSPDSRWLLVTITHYAAEGIRHEIKLVSADGAQTISVLSDWVDVVAGDWSPDGQWFSFTPTGDSRSGLYLAQVTDGAVLHVEAAGKDVGWVSEWSPDGQWIVYTGRCEDMAGRCVYRIHPDGTGRMKLAGGVDGLSPYFASYSPDGIWLAMPATYHTQSGSPDLFVLRADGTQLTQVARGMVGTNFEWTPPIEHRWHGAGWLLVAALGLVMMSVRNRTLLLN